MASDAAEAKLRELQQMDPVAMSEEVDRLLEVKKGDRYKRTVIGAELRSAHRQKKERRAAEGTEVHALCESLEHGDISVDDVPDEYLGYVEAYQNFRDEYPGMKFIGTELTVAGRTTDGDGYMGTTDGIVEYNGKRYILDIKTKEGSEGRTPQAYDTEGQQLVAAANADDIVFSDGSTQPMYDVDGGIALVIDGKGQHAVYLFEAGRDGMNFEGFSAARKAWNWKRKTGGDPKPLKAGAL